MARNGLCDKAISIGNRQAYALSVHRAQEIALSQRALLAMTNDSLWLLRHRLRDFAYLEPRLMFWALHVGLHQIGHVRETCVGNLALNPSDTADDRFAAFHLVNQILQRASCQARRLNPVEG